MELSKHLLHGVGVDLTHVFAFVHVLDGRYSQVPRSFAVRADSEPRIGRDQLTIHRNEHMSVDVHPCYLKVDSIHLHDTDDVRD